TFVGAVTGNASTATALAANPTDCSANQFATTIAANGNLTCAAIAANNLPSVAADLGAANVTINFGNTNGAFNTNIITDGTITATTFIGAVTGNASTASALAADPSDCSANQFAITIAANGNLTCASLLDADIPNTITINLAAAATALQSDPTDCAANQFATTIAANGNLTCASITDADVSNTLTASIFIGSGSTTNAIDLATAEVAGILGSSNISGSYTGITGTGALTVGSIASGFGTISTGNIITTSGTIGTASTTTFTGAGATFSAAIAANSSITSTQATFVINASGTVDVQDTLNVDSLTTDTGGVSIAAGQSYTGAGAVTLASATASGITINSGTTGSILIGSDASAETISLGSGNAVKTLELGLGTSGNTIRIGTNNTTADSILIGSALDTQTYTGNSSSAFVINAITVDATEFNRLDGKDAALVDQNDFISGDGAGATSNGSGLESGTGGIGLLQGCANNDILKWVDASSVWNCAVDATGISDARLKTNITNVGSVLDKIGDIRLVNFDFDCSNEFFDKTLCDTRAQTGVIAQELAQVFPELVYEQDGFYRVRYDALAIYNMKAVIELAQHINGQGDAILSNIKAQTIDVTSIITERVTTPYRVAESVSVGDVVTVDDQGLLHRSSTAFQKGLAGVVAGAVNSDGQAMVASAGRVNVNIEGSVQTGDPLTSSGTPGLAKKAVGSGAIIGVAATSGSGQVQMIVSTSFFGGDQASYDQLQNQITTLQDQVDGNTPIDLSNLHVGTLTADFDTLINGALTVSGDALFNSLVTFVRPVIFSDDVIFNGNVSFNSNTGGYAVINTGAQSVHITFSKPYSQPPIITLGLGGSSFAQYSYDNVTADGFDIVLAVPAGQNLNFTWTAISVNNPNTFVQQ
nr:tail fiber domain-containing protein [Candidatus Saccharibacteria bacterium]